MHAIRPKIQNKMKIFPSKMSRVNIANWTGPIQEKLLKEHHLSVAGIWDCKPKALKPEDRYHAVYIKEIIKNPGIKASQKKLYTSLLN